jgi:hypothetical protein
MSGTNWTECYTKAVTLFYCPLKGCGRNLVLVGDSTWQGTPWGQKRVALLTTLVCCWLCCKADEEGSIIPKSLNVREFDEHAGLRELRDAVCGHLNEVEIEVRHCSVTDAEAWIVEVPIVDVKQVTAGLVGLGRFRCGSATIEGDGKLKKACNDFLGKDDEFIRETWALDEAMALSQLKEEMDVEDL